MEKYSKDIENLLTLIKNKNQQFKVLANDLLDKIYEEQKNKDNQYAMVLLNFILNNYSLREIQTNCLKDDLDKFKKIVQLTSTTPYPNITQYLLSLKMKKPLIDSLVDGVILTYKEYQIEYISKFYSKITKQNLELILGKETVTEEFLKSKGWKPVQNYVLIENKSKEENMNVARAMNTIQFIGEMNTQLTKIIKANSLLDTKLYN
jgi:hypothetical protein